MFVHATAFWGDLRLRVEVVFGVGVVLFFFGLPRRFGSDLISFAGAKSFSVGTRKGKGIVWLFIVSLDKISLSNSMFQGSGNGWQIIGWLTLGIDIDVLSGVIDGVACINWKIPVSRWTEKFKGM